MKFFARILVAIFMATSVAGCANMTKEQMGAVLGGGTGVLLGSQMDRNNGGYDRYGRYHRGSGFPVWTLLLGVGGVLVGGAVGKSMDQADQERAARVAYTAYENPRPVTTYDTWQGARGEQYDTRVTTQPQVPYQGQQGCKPFVQETTVRINGRPETATQRGVVCPKYNPEYGKVVWEIQN